MMKWEYIRLISRHGSAYGTNGGVLDLLEWCNKKSTAAVTLEEARTFWETVCQQGEDSEQTSSNEKQEDKKDAD